MNAVFRMLFGFFVVTHSPAHGDVTLLLSDETPSILALSAAIQKAYDGRVEVYNLRGDVGTAGQAADAVRLSSNRQVVAVGLLAAQTARQRLSSKQVVFAQVLNYESFDLVTPWMKGVRATPPLGKQFRAWKAVDPKLLRVGVITGPGMTELVREAESAAEKNGIELRHLRVSSDRAVMPALKELRGSIDGLWLAPDSSILNGQVIREVVHYCAKQGIEVLVFAPSLLPLGGLIAGGADSEDAAKQIVARLRQARSESGIPGPAVAPLSIVRIEVNRAAAQRFGLSVPDNLSNLANAN